MTRLSRFVESELMEHAGLLVKMRTRLVTALEPQIKTDRDGRPYTIEGDVTDAGVPNADWCRAYNGYRDGFKILMEEQRERDKLVILARTKSDKPMSDEEYAERMAELMTEAVEMADTRTLEAEIKRREAKR